MTMSPSPTCSRLRTPILTGRTYPPSFGSSDVSHSVGTNPGASDSRSTNGTMARVLSRPMADNVGDMLDSDLRATLVDVERLGWDSLCDSTGADFYGKIMTEDAVMVLANGAVMDRSAVVDALRQAPPWRRYDISDARLIEAGLDSVVLVYVGSAYRDGDDLISTVRCRASTSGEATNGASSPGPYVG